MDLLDENNTFLKKEDGDDDGYGGKHDDLVDDGGNYDDGGKYDDDSYDGKEE